MLYDLICAFYLINSLVRAHVHSTKREDFSVSSSQKKLLVPLSLTYVFFFLFGEMGNLAQGISFVTSTQNKTSVVFIDVSGQSVQLLFLPSECILFLMTL